MATKPCGDDLESLQVLRYQDSHVQIPTPSRRVSPPTSRRAPGYKLNSDLAKESRNMKVRWYHRHTPTILNFPTTGCVGVPNSPNTSLYTCEFEEQLRINGEEGGSGAPVSQRLYENRKGTKLCSCCAAHYPNSMLSQSRWKKVKDVEERPPKVVDLRKEEVKREISCRANMKRVAENKKYARILRRTLRRRQMYSIYFRGDRKEYKGCIERVSVSTGQVEVRCCPGGKRITWDAKLFYLVANGMFQNHLVSNENVCWFNFIEKIDGNDIITID